jgi:hypothetical protein
MTKQRKRMRDSKSGIKGVTKASKTTWKAQIFVNGENIHLGSYPTQSQAADVYWEAAKLHFGEFAKFESRAASSVENTCPQVLRQVMQVTFQAV